MKKLYHFLGSAPFAIILISLTALFVAVGTFLEAHSESHLFSAQFTYHNPIFLGLLWGFFLNILISALRRWPFQVKHIPFLTTHLGLLMIILGVILKGYVGTQGSMGVMEGGSSHTIFLPNTYALHVEKRGSSKTYPLKQIIKQKVKFDDVEIALVDFSQHSYERKETWIKDHQAVILGLPSIPVSEFPNLSFRKIRFHHEGTTPWKVSAFKTDQLNESTREAYIDGVHVKISETQSGRAIASLPLNTLLSTPFQMGTNRLLFTLDWTHSPFHELEQPKLFITVNNEKMQIALSGSDSLINQNITSPHRGKLPFTIDLSRDPTLFIVQDNLKNDHLYFFNASGEVHTVHFDHDNISSIIAYDEGYQGYTLQTPFPFGPQSSSRQEKENIELDRLTTQLRNYTELSPPLELLRRASAAANQDFPTVALRFLSTWDHSHSMLMNVPDAVTQKIDWNLLSPQERNACGWLCKLLDEMEKQMEEGKSFLDVLTDRGWPFIQQFAQGDPADTNTMITLFSQQLFAAASQLPSSQVILENQSAKALSAFLRVYGITLNTIREPIESTHPQNLILETPLTLSQTKAPAFQKWEDNHPYIQLEIRKGARKEYISLTYDKYGTGLQWPILDGEYLVRFQPEFQQIPYKVRLHDARQINYPGSAQPYSYESDIIVTDLRTNKRSETTISMNNVHETPDGYRFYLASLTPPHETAAQRVQIIINHDPAKYLLTYPGAIVMSLGILLLFWLRPYKKR